MPIDKIVFFIAIIAAIICAIIGVQALVSHFKKEPEMGEKRLKTAFLFFPKALLNDKGLDETRWLKRVTWTEMYYGDLDGWIGFRWIDEDEKVWRY
jgi:hypothetical protein